MKKALHARHIRRTGAWALSLVLALAVLAAALPRPVAAATCDRTHVVQEGETTGQIARRYDMKWNEIAKANGLKYPYELEPGQKLCIPGEEEETTTNFSFSLEIVGGNAFITVNKLPHRTVFTVKARPTEVGVGGWRKLGTIRAGKNEKVSTVLKLNNNLMDSLYISVCLKNASTDELTCKNAINIR